MDMLDAKDLGLLICLLHGGKEVQLLGDLGAVKNLLARLRPIGADDAIGVRVILGGVEKVVPARDVIKPGFINSKDPHSAYMSKDPWLALKDKSKLIKALDTYIEEYEQGALISTANYLSYKSSMEQILKILGKTYSESGSQFLLPDHFPFFDKLRIYEFVLALHKGGYLAFVDCKQRVTDCEDLEGNPWKRVEYCVVVRLNKSPREIRDIHGYWEYYGDIRLNESDGTAFYKVTRYPAKSTKRFAFKLLVQLVRNAGKKVLIDTLFDTIDPSDPGHKLKIKTRKDRVEGWMKEVRKNLGLHNEKPATVSLMTVGDYAILVANPPKKP